MEPVVDNAEILRIISHIADRAGRSYTDWTTRDDIHQELYLYYRAKSKQIEKWLEDGEKFRVMRAFFGAAKQYAEREKAAQAGYQFNDIYWYDPSRLVNLVQLALNGGWDGLTGVDEDLGMPHGKSVGSDGGDLVAMVCDIRRVLRGRHFAPEYFDPLLPGGTDNLQWLSNKLGGSFPAAPGYEPGRRRVMSNESARYETGKGY